jgi:hypothetical protein
MNGAEIKVVDRRGQISLGKSLAGKALLVDLQDDGSIVLRMVPERHLWTVEEPHRSRIARGLAWASATEPKENTIELAVTRQAKTADRKRGRQR